MSTNKRQISRREVLFIPTHISIEIEEQKLRVHCSKILNQQSAVTLLARNERTIAFLESNLSAQANSRAAARLVSASHHQMNVSFRSFEGMFERSVALQDTDVHG